MYNQNPFNSPSYSIKKIMGLASERGPVQLRGGDDLLSLIVSLEFNDQPTMSPSTYIYMYYRRLPVVSRLKSGMIL